MREIIDRQMKTLKGKEKKEDWIGTSGVEKGCISEYSETILGLQHPRVGAVKLATQKRQYVQKEKEKRKRITTKDCSFSAKDEERGSLVGQTFRQQLLCCTQTQ